MHWKKRGRERIVAYLDGTLSREELLSFFKKADRDV